MIEHLTNHGDLSPVEVQMKINEIIDVVNNIVSEPKKQKAQPTNLPPPRQTRRLK